MTPLEAAQNLANGTGPDCYGMIHYDARDGRGHCGFCGELIPGSHYAFCPVLQMPAIIANRREREREASPCP